MLINEVDNPGSDIEDYISSLDAILGHKIEVINILRSKVNAFREHLKEEEDI